MVKETDMSKEKKWFYQERAKIVVTTLQKKNVNAQYVSTQQEALPVLLAMIDKGVTVARGDSVTIDQVGIIPELRKRNQNKIIYPLETDENGLHIIPEIEERK